jgi:acetyl-CoA carboxylase biotin carboxyl carrier protein
MPKVAAHVTGTVTRIEKHPGLPVAPGEAVVILESMEMPVEAEASGRVKEIRRQVGQPVSEGDVLAVIE